MNALTFTDIDCILSLSSEATTGLAPLLAGCSKKICTTHPHVFHLQNSLYSLSHFLSKLSFHLQSLIQTISSMLISSHFML